MITRWYAIGILALLIFSQEPGCSGAQMFRDTAFEGAGKRFDEAYGTKVQAAGDSSDAVDSMREVEKLNSTAVSEANLAKGQRMSFYEIDLAIEKMPGQASLYTDRAAMSLSIADEQLALASRSYALGIHYAATPDPAPGDANATTVEGEGAWNYRNEYVKSLTKVRAQLKNAPDRANRLEREICGQYRAQPTFRDKAGVVHTMPLPAGLKC